MSDSPIPDITVEDLLKIIGDKEVQLMRQASHIKTLSERILKLAEPTPLKAAKAKAS
jgi:hypothetical protein